MAAENYKINEVVTLVLGEPERKVLGTVIEVAPTSTCLEFEDEEGITRKHWFDTARGKRLGDTADAPYRITSKPGELDSIEAYEAACVDLWKPPTPTKMMAYSGVMA